MRLTVGPLPAAVYWRRRFLVLGLLALLIVMMSYACGGSDPSTAGNTNPTQKPVVGGTSASVFTPVIGGTPQPTTSVSAEPTSSAFALPTTGVTGPCTDSEMRVSAVAVTAKSPQGDPLDLTIKFRNIGLRTCRRDIGADVQELRIMQGKSLVWSSDDCSPNHGHNVRSFTPNEEALFKLRWSGQVSRTDTGDVTCGASAKAPPVGSYDLVGRLDDLVSEPFAVSITKSS